MPCSNRCDIFLAFFGERYEGCVTVHFVNKGNAKLVQGSNGELQALDFVKGAQGNAGVGREIGLERFYGIEKRP